MQKERIRMFLIDITALILVLALSVCAWFYSGVRTAHTESLQVDIPPILFVRDNEAHSDDSLQVLNLENLVIGSPAYIVFCVVPRFTGAVSSNHFTLQLAFTTNIRQTITLYRVTEISPTALSETSGNEVAHYKNYYYRYASDGVPIAADNEQIQTELSQNGYSGTYQRYTDQDFNIPATPIDQTLTGTPLIMPDTFWRTNPATGEKIEQASFYVMKISWENGNQMDVDPKETDLLYVYVKAE